MCTTSNITAKLTNQFPWTRPIKLYQKQFLDNFQWLRNKFHFSSSPTRIIALLKQLLTRLRGLFLLFFFFWDGSHHLMLLLIKHFFMNAPTYTIRLHDQPALTLGFSSLLLYFFFLVKRWWKHLVSSVWISLLVYKNCV